MSRPSSYGAFMERELRRLRKMPVRTRREREIRAESLAAAVDVWVQERRAAREVDTLAREHITKEHPE